MSESILDSAAISGRYLFPQNRYVNDSFDVQIGDVELCCFKQIVDPDALTLVHFHGNGEAVADYLPYMPRLFASRGLNSLLVEYRQYGRSTGEAQLTAMLGDGEAVMKAAQLRPEQCIGFGRSIGSLYAIELAHRQPKLAGLIIESGIADPAERFLNYADLRGAGFSETDVLEESKRHFNHKRKLAEYTNPLLLLHTIDDGLVDISHAERNLKWSGTTQKELRRFKFGNHNSIFSVNKDEYLIAIQQFVEKLT